MITYVYDQSALVIQELQNGDDVEFRIKLNNPEFIPALRKVRAFFDSNNILTDVLFYTHPDNEYQIIVRQDYYTDFILSLFKHRLVMKIEWL